MEINYRRVLAVELKWLTVIHLLVTSLFLENTLDFCDVMFNKTCKFVIDVSKKFAAALLT